MSNKLTYEELKLVQDKMNGVEPEHNVTTATDEEIRQLLQDCQETRNLLEQNKVGNDNFGMIILNNLEREVRAEAEKRGIK